MNCIFTKTDNWNRITAQNAKMSRTKASLPHRRNIKIFEHVKPSYWFIKFSIFVLVSGFKVNIKPHRTMETLSLSLCYTKVDPTKSSGKKTLVTTNRSLFSSPTTSFLVKKFILPTWTVLKVSLSTWTGQVRNESFPANLTEPSKRDSMNTSATPHDMGRNFPSNVFEFTVTCSSNNAIASPKRASFLSEKML